MKKFTHPQRGIYRYLFTFFLPLLFSAVTFGQSVTGTVTDDSNKPLSGVTVVVKGTKKNNHYQCFR